MKIQGKCHENCLDIYWNKLNKIFNWYVIVPRLGYQYECYSNVENKNVNYCC